MRIILLAALSGLTVITAAPRAQETPAKATWEQVPERSIALVHDGAVLWRFHHDPAEPHVYFHPLSLPGTSPLTVDRPSDHVWHHGVWFSWKYIDGVNFWENAGGTDRPAGRTLVTEQVVDAQDDGSAMIRMHVGYVPGDAEPVLVEERTIRIGAPADDGSYRIDWTGCFTARAEKVVLDRTPLPGEPGGKAYGGYAGLSLRMVNLAERVVVTPEGPAEFNAQNRLRTRADGLDYSGVLGEKEVGIAVLAHPDNPNAPSPWYAIRSAPMTFFTPAVICYGPLELRRDESFTLRYRIVVHPGRWDAETVAAEARRFARQTPPSNPRKSP